MKVMIVVTHLLGTGHLARALILGRAFRARGDQVTVLSGGRAVPHFDADGIDLVQLPPVQAAASDFSTLLTEDGSSAGPDHMAARRDLIAQTLAQQAPDVLITELFPFGRRVLRDEFKGLLEAARAMETPPLVLSSIRDILAPPGAPAKVAFADQMVADFYDGVLVHADPDLVTLAHSWPVSRRLAPKLHYTGFVAPEAPVTKRTAQGGIIVSAGGGDVGDSMFEAALDAAYLMPEHKWLFLMGGSDARREALQRRAPPHVRVEAPRPDFRMLLGGAAASVSMCGYNTALDVLQTGVPAVLVPFDGFGEVEQGLRAQALSVQDGIVVVQEHALSGPALAMALAEVQREPTRPPRDKGMHGALRSANIARGLRAEQVRR